MSVARGKPGRVIRGWCPGERDDDCRIRRSTRKRVRPAGSVRADIITRLFCVFPVPPRTCDDICAMTTRTKITHFSTVSRPLEPRYFKNPSYLGSNGEIAVSLPIIWLVAWNYTFYFREKAYKERQNAKSNENVCLEVAMQCNMTLNNYSPVKMR